MAAVSVKRSILLCFAHANEFRKAYIKKNVSIGRNYERGLWQSEEKLDVKGTNSPFSACSLITLNLP